jgi:hypothetical protein
MLSIHLHLVYLVLVINILNYGKVFYCVKFEDFKAVTMENVV